ncbi:FecR family protein [Naasia lichenicola]|uniref:FecR protein domain-containing protein n=1 Tax=Naasia lichenicola TaxID=2565933 RepID=A0A4V3WTH4_9MICO|nr:FecR family protein [Naasia lichenicola]THG30750.1 hypothetical protein E6C64_08915 [Naasia lichenicola]THG31987.1 hypothetical protein E6C64_08060 [Naasia lichenicola]
MKIRLVRSITAAIAVSLVLAACTSGPTVDVSASASKVTLGSADGNPAEITDTETASMGDVVQTDSEGQAQLDYPDGSLTRLGPSTKLSVTTLDSAEAQRTVVSLDVGQTWHRVEKLVAENAAFEVSTPVGVAAVRGTAFEVDCTDAPACTITVMEGVVEFTTEEGSVLEITPYQRLVIPNPDGGAPVVAVTPSALIEADEWITANIAADSIDEVIPMAAASLAGEWTMAYDYSSVSGFLAPEPDTGQSTWTFGELTCDDACTFPITSSGGAKYLATLTDAGFTAATSEPQKTTCADPSTGEEFTDAYDYSIDVTADRTDDEATRSTIFAGTLVWHYVFNGQPSGFCSYGDSSFDEAADISISRN